MQTPKSRPGSLDVLQKKSPVAAAAPRAARRLKTAAAESDPMSSPNPKIRTPKTQSPKIQSDRRSPRTPVTEIQKKRIGKIPELESEISELKEELKKAKEQLHASEASKRQFQKEAEETKHQLMEITVSEDSRIDELRKLSHERDKTWQSELEAMQRQHEMDSVTLASAMNEITKLKSHLSESESTRNLIENLRTELGEMISVVEKLKGELFDAKEAEAKAREFVSATEKQLEIANLTLEMLRSDGMKMTETCNAMKMELEQSKFEVRSLEELVKQLEEEREKRGDSSEEEINRAKIEIHQLKSALEVAEERYHEEYIRSTLQIRSAYEQVEAVRSEYLAREMKLEEELKVTRVEIESLKEAKLRVDNEEDVKIEEWVSKKAELEAEFSDLKANLMDKEMELQSVMAYNESIKAEMEEKEREKKWEMEEVMEKIGNLTEEAEISRKKAGNAAEQLGAIRVTNTELETEMRKLKVQCDQWRKAAEAAAAMISSGGNNDKNGNGGKFLERTGSMEKPKKKVSGYEDDDGDEDDDNDDDSDEEMVSNKKKNGSMLMKKIGVLLRKRAEVK